MSELKPCPFCGKRLAVITHDDDDENDGWNYQSCAVVCDATIGGCGASGGYHFSADDAIEAWNQRSEAGK